MTFRDLSSLKTFLDKDSKEASLNPVRFISVDSLDMWIEEQIRTNPKITTEELARTSKKGLATIKRHIAKLTHIKYVGSGYSGHWEIIENNAET